jgi:hypothetical protein
MNWLNNKLKKLVMACGDLSPTCKHAARLQSEALDHPLTLRQRAGLRIHLTLCAWCRRYGKQIRFLREAAQEHPDELTESGIPTLSQEARDRLKRKLESSEK